MKLLGQILFLFFCGYSGFSQPESVKFGRIISSDFTQKVFTIDSSALAVVLYDFGYTYFTYDESGGIKINTDYHTKKRILSTEASDLGVLDIVYYSPNYKSGQSIYDFKGRTYWLENGLVKSSEVTSKDIFDTKLQNSLNNRKVTFPNVTGDCIIEYSYTISTPMSVRDKPYPWYFQDKYPVVYSEYTIGFPNFLDYTLLMTGYLPLNDRKVENKHMNVGHNQLDGMGSFHKYTLTNIPAFKEEAYISSRDNFISKINFELVRTRIPGGNSKDYSTSWDAINSTLIDSENFGRAILRKTNFLKDHVSKFSGITDKKERLRAVHAAMNGAFEVDDEQWSVFIKNEQKKVLDNKKGTPNQINGLFISLLRELDFDVNPVILSRRSNGAINRTFPMLDSFDYIIAKVNLGEETLLIDITDKSIPMGVLPFECLNLTGFEVKQGGGDFVDILPKSKYWTTVNYTTEIDLKNKKTTGKVDRNYIGYSGISLRNDHQSKGKDFTTDFQKSFGTYGIENLEIKNLEDNMKPVSVKYSFSHEEEEFDDPEFIYFNPMMSEQLEKNPFTIDERLYPVDFGYGYEDVFSNTIKIPDGYEVESVPKSEGFALPDKSASYTYRVSVDKNKGEIVILAKHSIKNPIYYADEYQHLKELFGYMVKKNNEQIVLKKK